MTDFVASEHTEVDEVVPYELAIHEETNRVRESRGLETVAYDPQIAYVSRKYSQKLADLDEVKHNIGGSSSERMEAFDIYCTDISENLYMSDITQKGAKSISGDMMATFATNYWLASEEGHRENLLSDEWAYEGIGVYVTADARVYVTQTFTARDCDGPGDPPRYGEGYDG
ncbi:CAP domain-containing protein [Haloglomus irregulare]|jgi:uncharacterized protein YkwD|nr:CAP domain-containing protein [Haloglomus irregulare]